MLSIIYIFLSVCVLSVRMSGVIIKQLLTYFISFIFHLIIWIPIHHTFRCMNHHLAYSTVSSEIDYMVCFFQRWNWRVRCQWRASFWLWVSFANDAYVVWFSSGRGWKWMPAIKSCEYMKRPISRHWSIDWLSLRKYPLHYIHFMRCWDRRAESNEFQQVRDGYLKKS